MAIKDLVTSSGKKVGTFDDDKLEVRINWPRHLTLKIQDPIDADVRKVAEALEPEKKNQRRG